MDNQLRSWNNIGLFSTDIGAADQYPAFAALGDDSAPLADRARAYLDVNCAQCHQPGGPTPVELDLRFDTPLAVTGTLDAVPQAGDLGIANARIITPGDHERSVLWQRLGRLDGERMPPLSSHVVDDDARVVIGSWIDAL
jgi:hypothetical protein